mmetsp:Transcript_92617/g.144472  ORF Transcript_92617/g.144472 Transcript_92617/m.144472 type:complete len:837 (+) Transcript_92617:68-2578(+)
MSSCLRWLCRLVPLLLVFEVNGITNPDRSQTFRPRDPAPRTSKDAAKLELSASGALIEHGSHQRDRFMLANKQEEIEQQDPYEDSWKHRGKRLEQQFELANKQEPSADPYDDSWKHRGDSSTSSEPNATSTSVHDGYTLGDYGVDVNEIHDARVANLTNFTHTWGDQKHNVLGLPSWAAVLVGGAAAALIVICTNAIGNRLSHPLPFFASNEQRLKDQIEVAKEKVKILEEAVKIKREQERKAAEEEARRQRGEDVKPEPGPSHDELVGEMLYRTQEVQEQAVGAVNDSLKQAAPLLARAAYVQNVFSENMKLVQERAGDMALREASSLYGKMREAVGLDDDPGGSDAIMHRSSMGGYDLPDWFTLDDENDLDPPPFALLVGGMFAPAQIKMTRANCQSQIVWNSIIVAICTACAIIDSHHDCPDELVWVWKYGMLGLNGADILCCSFIAAKCASAICVLSDDDDKIGRVPETGNAVWDMFIAMQANSGQFFKAYFKYQNIIDSPIYTFQKFLCFISLVWGFLGIYVTCMDVVEDTLACDAKVVLWFMHTYSFFFMLFLTWTTLGLIVWVLQKLSGLTIVTAPIMESAKLADEEVPLKMPVFQTLARSFLLRDSSTMLHIKARQLEKEVYKLEREAEETKTKLEQRKHYLELLDRERRKAYDKEKKLIETYKEKTIEKGGSLPGNLNRITDVTGTEGLAGESSSTPFFDGPSAADLFAQASSSVTAVQEAGFAATFEQTQQAAQSYAQESGLMQSATDALSSAQASATEAVNTAQQFAQEQGATDALTSAQQGSPSTAEVQPETSPQPTEPQETVPQTTEPTRPGGLGLDGDGESF